MTRFEFAISWLTCVQVQAKILICQHTPVCRFVEQMFIWLSQNNQLIIHII